MLTLNLEFIRRLQPGKGKDRPRISIDEFRAGFQKNPVRRFLDFILRKNNYRRLA